MKKIILFSLTVLFFACKESKNTEGNSQKEAKVEKFVRKIEQAHQKTQFLNNKAISYDIDISFGGQTFLKGNITQLTDGTKILLEKEDGTKIVFDGNEVFMYPKDKKDPMARFHVFTWSYFFTLPYKISDSGTQFSEYEINKWGEKGYETTKLTFKEGVGDTSKDWYILYKNPVSNYLEGAAYIVSYGKNINEAEKEPHAIKFCDIKPEYGVPMSTKWSFHNWTKEKGYGAQIGEAKISNVLFVKIQSDLFEKPSEATLVKAP